MHIPRPPESEATTKVYQASLDSHGYVMNLTRAWAWRPDVFHAFAALRSQLTDNSTLSKRELAVLVCATAAELGDSYCALAWGKTLSDCSDSASAAAVLRATAADDLTPRDCALSSWARKVVGNPNATTQDDIAQLREAGLTDREIAEATFFVGFRMAFSTVNDALGVQPDWQLRVAAPQEVSRAVDFGRPTATRDSPQA